MTSSFAKAGHCPSRAEIASLSPRVRLSSATSSPLFRPEIASPLRVLRGQEGSRRDRGVHQTRSCWLLVFRWDIATGEKILDTVASRCDLDLQVNPAKQVDRGDFGGKGRRFRGEREAISGGNRGELGAKERRTRRETEAISWVRKRGGELLR